MKRRKLVALLMALVMLLGMVPAAQAQVIWCPDLGLSHSWGPSEYAYGPCDWGMHYCTVCGAGDEVPPQHNWTTQITLQPGCDTTGYKEIICADCDSEQGNPETIPALGHDWGSWGWAHGSAPSCTEGAWQVRSCKRCGQMEDKWVAAGSHQWGSWSTVSAGNCQTPAKEQRSCSICGATESRNGDKGKHQFSSWRHYSDPTCTEKGWDYRKCSVCGEEDWKSIDPVDHVFGEWYVVAEPQVGVPGLEQRDCTYGCGTNEQREIPALEAESAAGLGLTLVLSSTPANGTHFVVGEEVIFTETWSNGTDKTLYPFSVSIFTCDAPAYGSMVDQICSWFAEDGGGPVAPGASGSHTLTVTVTEADVARGAIYAMAELLSTVQDGPDLENVTTPFITAPCGPDNSGDFGLVNGLTVTKKVTSTPDNGNYYEPGEVIFFEITATNTSAETLTNLTFHDPLITDAPGATVPTFAPGETASFQAFYVVTDVDAFAGSVTNVAYMTAADADGHQVVEYSNTVTVPCGHTYLNIIPTPGYPFGIFYSLAVVKKEESLPLNGQYYTEGEVIHYAITYTNDGELPLTDVQIWDVLNVTTPVASAEMLNPGESRVCYYQHTVTAEDVAAGFVMNIAHASYPVPNAAGFANSTSNVVISKTSADDHVWIVLPIFPTPGEDPEYDPGTGWFSPDAGEETPDFGTIDTDALHGGETYCVRTITGRDNVSATYETTFCTEHADTQSSALIMAQAAATPEMQMQSAAYAVALWRTEVESLYQEIFEAADPTAKTVVMTEYVRFLADLANYELMLKELHPDQPALVARKVAEIWENKCVDLCYDAHAAAAERTDSLLAVTPTAGSSAVQCTCVTTSETNGQKTDVQSYCPVHSFPFSMIDALLQGKDTAEVWTMVRQIWGVELTSAYNKIYEAMGDNKLLAMAEYNALTQWMMAREASLIALYPNNPEVVAQTMVKTIMDRVNDLCQVSH